jgi:hypothetical protein
MRRFRTVTNDLDASCTSGSLDFDVVTGVTGVTWPTVLLNLLLPSVGAWLFLVRIIISNTVTRVTRVTIVALR